MRVLYLTYDGLADPLGQSQILPYLSGLARRGHAITIVSFEKAAPYAALAADLRTRCADAGIDWVPLKYHKSPPVLSTLFDLLQLWFVTRRLHRKRDFAIVHCRSYVTSLVGMSLKKTFGLKFIFDMRGFWADERVEGGLWRMSNPLHKRVYKYFKDRERAFVSEADAIITLTENSCRLLEESGVDAKKISVIPTCVNTGLFDPARITHRDMHALRSALQLSSDDFVLLYLGSLGTWYMVEELVAFFDVLKRSFANAKLLVLSKDSSPILNREDIVLRKVSHSEVPLYVSIASAAAFFIRPTFSKNASSATKTAELLAMGIPVFCNTNWGDMGRFDLSDGIIAVNTFGEDTYQQAVTSFTHTKFDKQNLRQIALTYFNLEDGIEKYDAIYRAIS